MKKLQWLFFLLKFKIPILGFVAPKVLELNDTHARVKIKLSWKTKNHLNSMYFGALAVGADVAAGLHAFYFAEKYKKKVSFAFKGMSSEFIKRAESDVLFVIDQGGLIEKAILKSIETGERINQPINVTALNKENEIVATFVMISSMKCK